VGHLTYEPSEGSSSTQRTIEDSGEGLLEFLDEISRREGASAVIEYLKNINIRFYDGAGGVRGRRRFRLVIQDPFRADTAPEWLLNARTQSDDLEAAIYDFVDRHERLRLRKHAHIGDGRIRPESGFEGQITKFSIVEPKFSITQHMFRWANGDGS
jgi:hypothetical protein